MKKVKMFGAAIAACLLMLQPAIATAAVDQYTWNNTGATTSANVWNATAITPDGTKMVAANSTGYIYTSYDSGATWTERTAAGDRGWESLAISADGTKIIAAVGYGYIYTSYDSGATWTERTAAGSRNWQTVRITPDGTNATIAAYGDYIYTSADSGATWAARTNSGSRNWIDVAQSSDATKVVGVVLDGGIYTSTNTGSTWTARTVPGLTGWRAVASSADGSKLAAVPFNNASNVYLSSDYGASWAASPGAGSYNWSDVDISADGSTVIAGDNDNTPGLVSGKLHISTNFGSTWTVNGGISQVVHFDDISISSNAQTILTADYSGHINVSHDMGAHWTVVSGIRYDSPDWKNIATNIDGSKVIAVNYFPGGYMQRSTDAASTWQDLTGSGNHFWDSIASSSDGTRLTAVSGMYWYSDYIYTSTDSGSTWVPHLTDKVRDWSDVAMSADGKVQVASDWASYLYTSTDFGQTWTERMTDQNRTWQAVAVSADGSRLVATTNNYSTPDAIYTSTDFGQTWTEQSSAGDKNWNDVAMSADGMRIVVAANSTTVGSLNISTDGGNTWTVSASAGTHNWQTVAMSANGQRIVASATETTGLYVSNDYGQTWANQAGANAGSGWIGMAMSADGSIIYATNDSKGVFKGILGTAPTAPPTPASTAVSNNSFSGTGTPGSTIVATFPDGTTASAQVSVLGAYTVHIPNNVSLSVGDTVKIQERSAAGVLGAYTSFTVASSTLADTGVQPLHYAFMGMLMIAAGVYVVRRKYIYRLLR